MAGVVTHMLGLNASAGGASPMTGVLATRITSSTTTSPVPWNGESYDYTGWHDPGSNPSHCTVPTGVSLVRVTFCMASLTAQDGGMLKGGAAFRGQGGLRAQSGNDAVNAISAPIAVSATNYFEVTSAGNTTGASELNWMSVEVLAAGLQYALVYKSGTQALSANTNTVLTFDSEVADVGGWHDNVTNNSRLTVPSGVTLVRITGNFANTAGQTGDAIINCTKNGAVFAGGFQRDCSVSTGIDLLNAVSAVLVVTSGDYFELLALTTQASTVTADENTWFSIEEVPSSIKRCLCTLDVAQAIAGGVDEALVFTAEVYDTDGIHDNASNQSFFTAPSGVTEARISFNVLGPNASVVLGAEVRKNGAVFYGSAKAACTTAASDSVNGITAWVPCSPGDDFEVWVQSSLGITLAVDSRTWVCAEFR
jgi:hypothetical protein